MKIVELTFEDWKNKTAENNKYFAVFGKYNFEPNEVLIERRFDYKTGGYIEIEPFKVVISLKEVEKIKERQKGIFEEEIVIMLNKRVEHFEKEVSERSKSSTAESIETLQSEYLSKYSHDRQKYIPLADYTPISHKWGDGNDMLLRIQLAKEQRFLFEVAKRFDKYLDSYGKAPEPPKIEAVEEKKEKRIATIVILLFAQKVNQKEKFFDEPLNNKEQYNKFAAAINAKFNFNVNGSTLKKEVSTKETSKHRSKTFDLLKQFGYYDLSTQYQLESKQYEVR